MSGTSQRQAGRRKLSQSRHALLGQRRTFAALFASTAAFLSWQAPAQAQTLDDNYWISGAAFFPRVDTDLRVTSNDSSQVGTDIDFEKDLALDNSKTLAEVMAGARFGRLIIGLDYFNLKRSGSVGIARDIVFDDVTYPASATVSSEFKTDIYRFTVGYAIVQKPDLELGAAIGMHATDFSTSLTGEASVGGQSASRQVRQRDFLAPLPTLGLFGTYEIAPKVLLNGRVDYMSLNIDKYDGRLVNAQAAVTYQVLDNIGLGAAYRYVDYRVDVDKDTWNGTMKYKLWGPALILQASF